MDGRLVERVTAESFNDTRICPGFHDCASSCCKMCDARSGVTSQSRITVNAACSLLFFNCTKNMDANYFHNTPGQLNDKDQAHKNKSALFQKQKKKLKVESYLNYSEMPTDNTSMSCFYNK